MKKPSVLFVDDESLLLQGLRRSFHRLQGKWEMNFVESADLALALMEQRHVDVIVTDMRMPGTDGATLLAAVQARYPETIRFVLSGHSDSAMILRAVSTAHQFIAKPCDASRLATAIDRCIAFRDLLQNPGLVDLVNSMERLPVLPQIHSDLVTILDSEYATTAGIADVICRDTAITAKVLQIVNSAFFSLPSHVSNVEEAVVILGHSMLRSIVCFEGAFRQLKDSNRAPLRLSALSEQALAVATRARSLAKACGADAETLRNAFVAGLLHDLGLWILAAERPQELRLALDLVRNGAARWPEAESQVFGCTHPQLGGYILTTWGFDDDVVEAIVHHHNPRAALKHGLSTLSCVHVAAAESTASGLEDIATVIDEEYVRAASMQEGIEAFRGSHGETLHE